MPGSIDGLGAIQGGGLHGSVDDAMSAMGGMESEEFLNLLVAQLQYQSPMDPADPGDLMTQTSTLAQLDATQQLLQTQQRDFGLQQSVAATSMLGNEVTGTGADGGSVTGVVDGVRYTALGPVLDIGGAEVAMSDVSEIRHRDPTSTTDLQADDPNDLTTA